jgi:hypothetical protein
MKARGKVVTEQMEMLEQKQSVTMRENAIKDYVDSLTDVYAILGIDSDGGYDFVAISSDVENIKEELKLNMSGHGNTDWDTYKIIKCKIGLTQIQIDDFIRENDIKDFT